MAVIAPILWAGPAAAETTLEVDAGYAGSFVPGQQVPVRVRISADRLVRGSLEVGIGNPQNGTPVAMAVEVPGGGQKEFLLIAGSGLNASPDVVARLRQGDRLVASGQANITAAADTELVGLLPGAVRGRAVPGVMPLAVDAGTARFAAIGEAELDQAPASLGPLSTLAVAVDELGRMSPGARAGVLRWIGGGGRLLVDSARGQAVPGLPDAWQPGGRGRAAAGLGEVVATDGAIAAGRWSGLVEPSGRATMSARFMGGEAPLASTLAMDAGLRTPKIGWLVGFLAVYVLVVGPLLFLGVRRTGRPELAWVAVPLVAILFSTGSYVVGRNLRKATQLVHASVVSSGPEGPTATSFLGVFSRAGETARIGFPAGWTSGQFAGMRPSASPSVVTRTAEGVEVRLPLEAGQFGMVQGTGPATGSGTGALEITAVAEPNGQVAGSVRNASSFHLEEAALFLGSEASLLGSLAPGEQRPFSVVATGPARFDGRSPEAMLWGRFRGPDVGGPVDMALWEAAMRSGGVNFLAPGAVVAAGWTREYAPEVRVGGRIVEPEGRTVVVGRQQVAPAAQGGSLAAVRRDIVRDPFARLAGGPVPSGSVVRFVLPEGADTSKLVLRSPFGGAELWQDGGWKPAMCETAGCGLPAGPGGGPAGRGCPPGAPCPPQGPMVRPGFIGNRELSVPADAVREGVIYVRVPGPASDGPVPISLGRSA